MCGTDVAGGGWRAEPVKRKGPVLSVENETGFTQNEWRKRKTLYFICYCLSAIVGLIIAVIVNEALWYSAVGFDTMDNGITTGSLAHKRAVRCRED